MTLLDSFGETVVLTRYGAGSFSGGEYVAGSTAVSSIVMSVQPINGRELLNLPEAQRTRQFVKGYTDEELLTVDKSAAKLADVVTWNGKDYEVHSVEAWKSTGSEIAPHYKVLMAEVNT